MRFFLDNCISPRYAAALKILAEIQEYDIAHLRERFASDTKDVVWIPALAVERDWVIVSGDPRITRGKAERAAWHESGMTAFFFSDGWSSRAYWKQAADIVRWWPDIVLEARAADRGSGYLIPLHGRKFKKIYNP